MHVTATGAPPPSSPGLRAPVSALAVWCLVVIDVVVVALLPMAPLLLAAVVGATFFAFVVQRSAHALAFAVAGAPLLHAVIDAGGPEFVATRAEQLLVVGPLVVVGWRALWSLGRASDLGRIDAPQLPEATGHRAVGHSDPAGALGEASGRLFRSPLFWSTAALTALLWFGTHWSPSPEYAVAKFRGFVVGNLALLIAGALLLSPRIDRSARAPQAFVTAMVIFLAVLGIAALLNYYYSFHDWENRLKVLGLGPIALARFMGSALLCWLALRHHGRARGLRFWSVLGLLLVVFYFTGSRGPLVSLFLALVVWAVLSPAFVTRSWWMRALILMLGSALAVGALLLIAFGPWEVSPFSGHESSNIERFDILRTAVEWLGRAGWLGLGTGGFSSLMGVGDTRFYPHNLFAEVWIENGVLGLSILVVFLLSFTVTWILGWRRAVRERGAASTLWLRLVAAQFVFAFANAQFSGDIPANPWMWLWAGVLLAWSRVPR